jgi:N,N'-diacetyllegionaminate synthase
MIKMIAEVGVNHNGSIELAKKLIDAANNSGADAIKFQTYSADRLTGKSTPKVPYQQRSGSPGESHYEMLKKLELGREDHALLKAYCEQVGVEFCSTPYSKEDAEFLYELGVPFFKTASADLIDRALHEFIASSGQECLIAVGMASLEEVEATLQIYDQAGSRDRVTLLHCVSAYPAPVRDLNLRVLKTMADAFGVRVGYSDHSESLQPAVAAVALGADVIEKHFTIDRHMEGPDHLASSTPEEFSALVRAVREAEDALGHPVKRVQPSEMDMRRVSRKSIVAARPIAANSTLTLDDLSFQRPGTGLSPMDYPLLLGKSLKRNIEQGKMIETEDVDVN